MKDNAKSNKMRLSIIRIREIRNRRILVIIVCKKSTFLLENRELINLEDFNVFYAHQIFLIQRIYVEGDYFKIFSLQFSFRKLIERSRNQKALKKFKIKILKNPIIFYIYNINENQRMISIQNNDWKRYLKKISGFYINLLTFKLLLDRILFFECFFWLCLHLDKIIKNYILKLNLNIVYMFFNHYTSLKQFRPNENQRNYSKENDLNRYKQKMGFLYFTKSTTFKMIGGASQMADFFMKHEDDNFNNLLNRMSLNNTKIQSMVKQLNFDDLLENPYKKLKITSNKLTLGNKILIRSNRICAITQNSKKILQNDIFHDSINKHRASIDYDRSNLCKNQMRASFFLKDHIEKDFLMFDPDSDTKEFNDSLNVDIFYTNNKCNEFLKTNYNLDEENQNIDNLISFTRKKWLLYYPNSKVTKNHRKSTKKFYSMKKSIAVSNISKYHQDDSVLNKNSLSMMPFVKLPNDDFFLQMSNDCVQKNYSKERSIFYKKHENECRFDLNYESLIFFYFYKNKNLRKNENSHHSTIQYGLYGQPIKDYPSSNHFSNFLYTSTLTKIIINQFHKARSKKNFDEHKMEIKTVENEVDDIGLQENNNITNTQPMVNVLFEKDDLHQKNNLFNNYNANFKNELERFVSGQIMKTHTEFERLKNWRSIQQQMQNLNLAGLCSVNNKISPNFVSRNDLSSVSESAQNRSAILVENKTKNALLNDFDGCSNNDIQNFKDKIYSQPECEKQYSDLSHHDFLFKDSSQGFFLDNVVNLASNGVFDSSIHTKPNGSLKFENPIHENFSKDFFTSKENDSLFWADYSCISRNMESFDKDLLAPTMNVLNVEYQGKINVQANSETTMVCNGNNNLRSAVKSCENNKDISTFDIITRKFNENAISSDFINTIDENTLSVADYNDKKMTNSIIWANTVPTNNPHYVQELNMNEMVPNASFIDRNLEIPSKYPNFICSEQINQEALLVNNVERENMNIQNSPSGNYSTYTEIIDNNQIENSQILLNHPIEHNIYYNNNEIDCFPMENSGRDNFEGFYNVREKCIQIDPSLNEIQSQSNKNYFMNDFVHNNNQSVQNLSKESVSNFVNSPNYHFYNRLNTQNRINPITMQYAQEGYNSTQMNIDPTRFYPISNNSHGFYTMDKKTCIPFPPKKVYGREDGYKHQSDTFQQYDSKDFKILHKKKENRVRLANRNVDSIFQKKLQINYPSNAYFNPKDLKIVSPKSLKRKNSLKEIDTSKGTKKKEKKSRKHVQRYATRKKNTPPGIKIIKNPRNTQESFFIPQTKNDYDKLSNSLRHPEKSQMNNYGFEASNNTAIYPLQNLTHLNKNENPNIIYPPMNAQINHNNNNLNSCDNPNFMNNINNHPFANYYESHPNHNFYIKNPMQGYNNYNQYGFPMKNDRKRNFKKYWDSNS